MDKEQKFSVIWTLRSRICESRWTRHIYSGLSLVEAKTQARTCVENSIVGLENEFDIKVEIFQEDE